MRIRKNEWAITIFIFFVICVLLSGCGNKTLHMEDYITANFTGLNTVGEVEIEFDEKAFIEAALGKEPETANAAWKYLQDGLLLEGAFTYEVEPKENLSNGDKVTVKFTFDNESIKDLNIVLKGEEVTFDVEGLPEGKKIDPFQDVEVSFTGVSPNASIKIKNNSDDEFLRTVYYEAEKKDWLRIGDQVVVKIGYSKARATEAGYILQEEQKTYTVEGVPSYIESLKEFSESDLRVFQEDSATQINKQWENCSNAMRSIAMMDSELSDEAHFDSDDIVTKKTGPKMVGMYFLKAKDVSSANNQLGIVYEITVNDSNLNRDLTVYNSIVYDDLVREEDGKLNSRRRLYNGNASGYFASKASLQEYFTEDKKDQYDVEQNIFE